jgi:response regulator RpfG family c-di-GMP phosphodiesterase/CHASE3 domain sensor protein
MTMRGSRHSLNGRLSLAAGVTVAMVLLVFSLLVWTVLNFRRQTNERRDAQRVALAADKLFASVLDLETGTRAFVITRERRFLEPWRAARDRIPAEGRRLQALVEAHSGAGGADPALVHRINSQVENYLFEYSLPLVLRVESRRLTQRAATAEVASGKLRVDRLRGAFGRLIAMENAHAAGEERDADRAGKAAVGLALAGLVLLLGVVIGGLLYLARTVTRPVVRVAEAAAALADGRLEHPVTTPGAGVARELVSLTESFDAMADVVRDQRRRLQDDNALLERRVGERTAQLDQARYEALLMLAIAAEYRDGDTHRHTQRVGRNAGLVAEALQLGEQTVALLTDAAPLHDVGKIGISDAIMLKPGRLTPEEFETMKLHTKIGASILGSSAEPLFHIAAQVALTHHERWDGSGYPAGLAGTAIPLAGRIVAIVDVFDALTHSRPYKDAWPLERAVEEIRRGSGSHFDPDVVAAFISVDPHVLAGDARADEVAGSSPVGRP